MTARKTPEEIARNKERANRKRKLRHLWRGELTLDEIADELEMTVDGLLAMAEQMSLGPRPEDNSYIPTQEQIRLAAAEIRRGWTSAELEARRVSPFGRLE